MKLRKLLGLSFILLAVTGCAVGNQYDYRSASVALPLAGTGELGIGVIDNRSYVLSGDKEPNFIGLQRGGYGNPFNVTTASGNSLTQDMSESLENALRNSGYTVTGLQIASADPAAVTSAIAQSGVAKNIVLTVTEWKTDIYMNMTLHFDLLLEVVTKQGDTVASNQMQGEEKIGGGAFEGQNSRTAAAAFETKIGRLFNDPEILGALAN
ncbi:MAG: hypothetical protein OER22_14930 [Gammaproteobacteria bacterium]|nr:hypothetical protein [Gammaproteobacteria bacterium]MDH3553905.1 hypothetical protein [Gammaproteobacteria bacterium]